ncbi:MAG: hypothetical protein ONB44_14510 [candidate division KSB1 bacterium]|nr:hypothetical protein [candidate division KSB1 bacterium]MDZ7303339.1 hypothetical protein [candidate division KSB1 bacterium]MDZ7310411.1 hypothetical protein [candidate division KSB1 bacterium]
MIYIQIPEKQDAKGLYVLMTNGTVKCLPDNVYIINKDQLKLLDKHKIRYKRLKPGDVKLTEPKAYGNEEI